MLTPDAPIAAQSWSVRLFRAFFVGVSMLGSLLGPVRQPAWAQTGGLNARFQFDIPEQPLSATLDAYSVVTGLEIVYKTAIVGPRRSAAVKGEFVAADALRLLLDGSDLSARMIAEGAVTIRPLSQMEASPTPIGPPPEKNTHQHYYGLIQTGFERAFCRDDRLRPGRYRFVLSFTIGGDGQITTARVVGSSGDRDRDRMILSALDRATLAPPPPSLRQPITMAILPLDCVSRQARGPLP